MNDLISVIVPVYNVEEYLKDCVQSIKKQTYNNLEIIIIDDGSTDGSGKLCDEIKKSDTRIYVYHKENGGLSSARNYGIEKSHGNYITFIDSDDLVDELYIEKLYKAIKETNCRISFCKLKRFEKELDSISHENNSNLTKVTQHTALKNILYQIDQELYSVSVCNKMFEKKLFDGLQFPENKINEDVGIITDILDKVEYVAVDNGIYYFYRYNNFSITTKKFTIKNLDILYFLDNIKNK